MQQDKQEILQKVKTALRISSQNKNIEGELEDLIEECKQDLKQVGVRVIRYADPLIARAVKLYCKAEFYKEDSERYRKSYDLLKMSLALSGDYNEDQAKNFTPGEKVIVSGKVYKNLGDLEHWTYKSNADMYVVNVVIIDVDDVYIALAEKPGEEAAGYSLPEALTKV